MNDENKTVLETIKEQEIDALYEKKKHFNAADRKRKYNLWLGVPAVVINTIVGSIIFLAIGNIFPDWAKWVAVILALISIILTGLQTFFDFQSQISGHQDTGNKYLALGKEYKLLNAGYNDNLLELKEVFEELKRLAEKHKEINKVGSRFSTNDVDYKKAQDSFKKGGESYTEAEKTEKID